MTYSYSTDLEEEEVGFWELKRGNITLAMLEKVGSDSPWVECFFFPEPEFEPYREFFVRSDGVWRGRERELHEAIAREGIFLAAHDGRRLPAFTLVVNDSGARVTFTEV